MTDCRLTQLEMIGSKLSLDALQHLEGCSVCRARLCAEQSLTSTLNQTPSYDDTPSEAVEMRLLSALRPEPKPKVPNRRLWLAAAALFLMSGPALWFALRAPERAEPIAAVQQPTERVTPFLVLDPLSPDLAAGRGTLFRARLPPSASLAFGLPIPATQDALEADVLLGDDGAVYAVRLIY